jgi:hypothetical protein
MYSSYTFLVFCLFGLMDVSFLMSTFSLWQMSSESDVFVGFVDGASRHTRRLASASLGNIHTSRPVVIFWRYLFR